MTFLRTIRAYAGMTSLTCGMLVRRIVTGQRD